MRQMSTIPYDVLIDSFLSSNAKILYCLLLHHAWNDGGKYPGRDVLSQETGLTKEKVAVTLYELIERHLLRYERGSYVVVPLDDVYTPA